MGAAEILQLLVVVGGALAGVVWWFVRHTHAKVEGERRERAQDVTALRADVNAVGGKLQAHELHVAREYVNHDRLAATLKPLEDGMGGVQRTLERLFEKLEGKVDKMGGHD
jgi:acyl-CoA hydrolase